MSRKRVLVFFLVSFLLTLTSFTYQWYDEGEFGTECEQRILYDQPCLVPVLRGGFPLAYVIDAAGISVMGVLEEPVIVDDFLPIAFLLDILIYFLLLTGIWYWVRYLGKNRQESASDVD